jgi:NADH-quinone oxidoreductase subunit C
MSKQLVELVQRRFGPSVVLSSSSQHGDETIVVAPSSWLEVHQFLRDDPASKMNFLMDLCGVDFPDRDPRFEVVSHLMSFPAAKRLRVKARVGDEYGDGAEIDSLMGVWKSASWLERETWDLMGIRFRGHPDLRRILLYEEFEGHPLRKDYDAGKAQPLVPYREGAGVLDKIAPFGPNEGMAFGRQTHDPS